MASNPAPEREVHAARTQALFRSINEEIIGLSEAFNSITGYLDITCECADPLCLESLTISRRTYEQVREQPNRFVVLPGHVLPEVETVVAEAGGYAVVEKTAVASQVAVSLDARSR